jgi:hypothetical protein
MLRWISWSDFLITLIGVLLVYWFVIVFLYYKQEIWSFFKKVWLNNSRKLKGMND